MKRNYEYKPKRDLPDWTNQYSNKPADILLQIATAATAWVIYYLITHV